MEKVLSLPVYREQRREILRLSSGRVLEIGFGFGGTLAEYPGTQVREVVALEPNPGMVRRARRSVALAPFPVRFVRGVAAAVPFPPRGLGTGGFHWNLCRLDP